MANDVALFGNNLVIPAHLQVAEIDDMTRKLAGGSGGLRVSIKGGVFRLLRDGDEIARNEERSMDFVVVASSNDTARSYYEGTFVEGENKPPSCWSTDGVKPDDEVAVKQSPNCATCMQNVAGSGQGDSRACRYSRRLAVVVENDIGGSVYQLSVPAQSLFGKPEADGKMPLQAYAKLLAQHRIPINRVATEFKFDTNSATPKLTFRAKRPLSVEECAVAEQQGQTPEAQAAIKMTVFAQDGGKKGEEPAPPPLFEGQDETVTIGQTATVPAKPAAAGAPAPAKKRTKPPAPGAAPAPAAEAAPAAKKPPPPKPKPVAMVDVKVMTEAAAGATYESFVDEGWTDDDMISEGYMVIEKQPAQEAAPAPKVVPPAASAATATETPGIANILAGMDDDE